MSPPIPATDYGRRPLAAVIQERASNGHTTPFGLVANAADLDNGFTPLSYAQLNAAADACAAIIANTLGNSPDFTSFAWLGSPSDLRYTAMLVAAMKTKKTAFFPSPRNSLPAHLSLLERTQCSVFFVPDNATPPIVNEIMKERPMKLVQVPAFNDLAASNPDPINFTTPFDKCWLDPVCVLHTSGSTGIPKPITVKHQFWSSADAFQRLPTMGLQPYPLAKLPSGSKTFVPAPFFHVAGLFVGFICTVYFDLTLVSAPSTQLSADSANKVFDLTSPMYTMLPGPIIKDLVEEPAFRKNASKVKLYSAAGAPISQEIGQVLTQFADYINIFGMSEASGFPNEAIDVEDYQYHRFSPVLGADFRPIGNNQFELVIVRKPGYELFQSVFSTFPHLDEWGTNDMWSPHPSKPDLWTYRGRLDDIIVFSNGEKLNPLTIEGAMTAVQGVAGALVVGQGQFQPALIVEPSKAGVHQKDLTEQIWSKLVQVNKDSVAHGRIAKDMIILASPEKPFLRAGKGSIQRRMTVDMFQPEIEQLYASQTTSQNGDSQALSLDLTRPDLLPEALRFVIASEVDRDPASIALDADLFSVGLDSLLAANISRQINRALKDNILTPRMIYNNPTIAQLATVLSPSAGAKPPPSRTRLELMQEQLETLSASLPMNARPLVPMSGRKAVVLLVGSTGSLGPLLLHRLLQTSSVAQVYCLNRTADAPQRQKSLLGMRGLEPDLSRATFLTADSTKPYFGLQPAQYKDLLHETTHVLHNAWPVNFNAPLSSFRSSLHTLQQLITFSTASAHNSSLHFLSSVSANLYHSSPVPETVTAISNARNEGYAESKAVAESLLAAAAQISGISAHIYRLGQLSGPLRVRGAWSKDEWLPSILGSVRALDCLPADLGPMEVDWVPVDDAADAVVELLLARTSAEGAGHVRVRNVVNPHSTTWSALLPTVAAYFAKETTPLPTVPFSEWVAKLAATSMDNDAAIPASRLLSFFESLAAAAKEGARAPKFSTDLAASESSTMQTMKAVAPGDMHIWLGQWGF